MLWILPLGIALADEENDPRFQRFDIDADGRITSTEAGNAAWFQRADLDGDRIVTHHEAKVFFESRGAAAPRRSSLAATEMPAEPALIKKDIRYREETDHQSNVQSLDLYLPPAARAAPVIVYVHGGGWKNGDKSHVGAAPSYFNDAGWIFVSVNYQLLPTGKHPSNIDDVAHAVAWVHTHIAEYGGDASRLFVFGHSAGAHLVALLATDERRLRAAGKDLNILRGVIPLDTNAYDIASLAKRRGSDNLYTSAFGKDPAIWRDASPIAHVAAGKGIPPMLLFHSGTNAESRSEQGLAFVAKLREAGVAADLVSSIEQSHDEINRAFGTRGDMVTETAWKFLNGLNNGKGAADASVIAPSSMSTISLKWEPSLTFDAETTKDGPLPVNGMQLVTHRGMLFCGMATSFEQDRYSGGSSYIYAKASADDEWKLEADFGPGTSRVGQMYSARFVNDALGRPIAGGPQEILVAFTMRAARRSAEAGPVQMRVRNDATGEWDAIDLPTAKVAGVNVREICLHRDRVTGADLLFVGANPAPLGIFCGGYDANAPGGIGWKSEAEIAPQGRRNTSKWFGMAEVNGVLFASDVNAVFRRSDGPQPKWTKVLQFAKSADEDGAAVRGLTAVPNPASVTGWSEPEMMIFGTQMKLWRMRVPAEANDEHTYQAEIDLVPYLSERLGEPIVFAESAFNRLTPVQLTSNSSPLWPIGFQVVYPVPGKQLANSDPSSFRLKDDANYLLRDSAGNYSLHQIEGQKRLFLARDFKPSPFANEPDTLYSCGFNGSYWKGSLGTAWIYRGSPK